MIYFAEVEIDGKTERQALYLVLCDDDLQLELSWSDAMFLKDMKIAIEDPHVD